MIIAVYYDDSSLLCKLFQDLNQTKKWFSTEYNNTVLNFVSSKDATCLMNYRRIRFLPHDTVLLINGEVMEPPTIKHGGYHYEF